MFERFTNQARHVVVLSQEEARLFSHNYIGTEHILLGLLGEPDSTAGTVLTSFGITRESVRAEVTELVGRGKTAPSGHIPFTPRAKKTLELSLREALAIKHNYIGTEHILLGLIREGEGLAFKIMSKHADLAEIRAAVLSAVPEGEGESAEGAEETNLVLRWLRNRLGGRQAGPLRGGIRDVTPAPGGTPAVEAALRQAASLAGELPVGSHHLLLAAMADANSAASSALASLGVNLDELRERLLAARVEGTSDEQPEQAGRRQMSVEVTGEALTVVLTDPVIVQAGRDALRVVNARAAAKAAAAAATTGTTGAEGDAAEEARAEAPAAGAAETVTVIRGDLPEAAGLADVWLELRRALNGIVDPGAARRRRSVSARKPGESAGPADPAGESEPAEESGLAGEGEPGTGEAAG